MPTIASSILKNTKGFNRGGGRASANVTIKKVKGRGNQGSFGNRKNSKAVKSINSGGNFGPIGY